MKPSSEARIRKVVVFALVVFCLALAHPTPAAQLNGIDVSHWEGDDIQWTNVYNAGYVFAFTKATESTYFIDDTLDRNMTNARAAGVLIGCYHFARPNNNTANAEADFFVSVAGKYMTNGYLRPVLDVEDGYQLGKTALSTWVNAFVNRVKTLRGVEPLVYCNPNYAINYLNNTVTNWNLWIAHYNVASPLTGVWSEWNFWQYSETGTVPGINYATDLDVFNGTMSELLDFVIGGGTNPPSITQQPANKSVVLGGSATFTVGATGSGDLSYRWQKHNTNLNNGGHYSGCTTPSLTVTNVDLSDVASYRCVVTNNFGSTNSSSAALTIAVGCAPGLLVNADFEGGNTSGVATGWTKFQRAPNPTTVCSIQIAGPPAGGGLQYQQIANTSSTGGGGVRQDITGCVVGATYTIAGWMRGNSTLLSTCRVKVSPSASTDWATAIDLSPVQTYTGSSWTPFSGTVAATGTSMTLWLDGQTGGTGENKAECFDSITVTCLGAPSPLHIDSAVRLPQKQLRLVVSGEPGGSVTIQRSSNLVNWVTWTNLVNAAGTVEFTDVTTNATLRYYRAKTP